MTTTGYSDTFNRTVSGGLGTATSGQAYTVAPTAAQFSVAPSVATIAINATGNWLGLVDRQTYDVDISGQVALTAIPASNLATVGFLAKASSSSNYYAGTMMVATGGAVSLRFSKVVAGGLVTIATVALTGVTYVANTFYNLRFAAYWSNLLQTNVLQLKLWVTTAGTTEPGGWMATAQDAAFTPYTAGTQTGLYARDESTTSGTVSAKIQNVAVKSYNLPMPAATDPMCADPAIAYPKTTAFQDLAQAADAAISPMGPLASLAALFPRVRVSATLGTIDARINGALTYDTTEFNISTPTNLGYDNTAISLPVGIWMVTFEIQLAEAVSTFIQVDSVATAGSTSTQTIYDMRSNAAHLNDLSVGGCGHFSALVVSADPANPVRYTLTFSPGIGGAYTISYMALSAIKISDYFL